MPSVGWLPPGVVLWLVGLLAFGSFNQNASIFGRVVHGRGILAPVMALTFDDGPSPETTPRVLDALRDAGARATFFVLGKHVKQHPELVRRIVSEGHEVANHGWTHQILVFAGRRQIQAELAETQEAIAAAGAPKPKFFRAPHGFRGPLLAGTARKLGYQVVGWTTGVFDTALPGAAVIAERSRHAMHPGAILLLHDGDGYGDGDRSQTAEALPTILADMHERGLTPVTVSEIAALEAQRSRSWRRILLVAALVAVVVGVALYRGGWHELRAGLEVFEGLSLGLVGAAILANLVSIALKATVWKASIESVPTRPPVRYPQIVAAIFIGFLMNSVLVARAGELGRAIVLRRRILRDSGVRVPLGTITGTVVSETLVLGATLVALLLVMTFTVSGLPTWVTGGVTVLLGVVLVMGALVLALEFFSRRRRNLHRRVLAPVTFGFGWIVHHAERVIHELSQGHQIFTDPRRASVACAAGVLSWIANLVAIWLTLLAFGISGNAFAAAVVVFAVSNLVGVVQLTPGNVGVFQVAVALALSRAFGVDRSVGISFGIGLQAIEVALGAGLGAVFLAMEGVSLAEVRADITEARAEPAEPPRESAHLGDARH